MQRKIDFMGPPEPKPEFKIRASFARLAATAMAKTDIRYYLNGILVEARPQGGAFIVATNGHHMLAIIDPQAVVKYPGIIRPSQSMLSACPKVGAANDRDEVTLEATLYRDLPALVLMAPNEPKRGPWGGEPAPVRMDVADVHIEGRRAFPDWRRVLPDFSKLERGARGEFCQEYLSAPFKAMCDRQCFGGAADSWQVPSESKEHENALIRRLNGRDDIIHIVMPRRRNDGEMMWISNFADARKVAA